MNGRARLRRSRPRDPSEAPPAGPPRTPRRPGARRPWRAGARCHSRPRLSPTPRPPGSSTLLGAGGEGRSVPADELPAPLAPDPHVGHDIASTSLEVAHARLLAIARRSDRDVAVDAHVQLLEVERVDHVALLRYIEPFAAPPHLGPRAPRRERELLSEVPLEELRVAPL